MTLRQAYEFTQIECNKLKAPSVLLEDFIYLFNKAIQQYVNSVYNRAEYNQQSSDDIGCLQTTTIIDVDTKPTINFGDKVWTLNLPSDYLHLLNCIVEFKGLQDNTHCQDNMTKVITSPCQRLTADLYPGILNNYYMKPSYKKPYFYITSNSEDRLPLVKIEIHTGNCNMELNKLYLTYLRTPKEVSMDQFQVIQELDETEQLEFPDYVCYEIINTYVRLLLENASDPRLQTNVPINQTISVPGNN